MSAINSGSHIDIDLDLLKKYDRPGPRYTSYPTAPHFHDGVKQETFLDHLKRDESSLQNQDLSLYVHIPFCDTLCYFCGCNMMVTRNQSKIEQYLDYLEKEVILLKKYLAEDRKIIQMHWGGGTPTHLTPDQIRRLGEMIRKHFDFQPNAEVALEIDPRELTREHMVALKEVGFNRCSMGIQDFDPKVQKTVNRLQSEEITSSAVQWSRELGFTSLNLDLMYGLPYQTLDSFETTIDKVLEMNPDRLAVFNYAHLPSMIKHQQLIKDEWLPSADEKLELLKLSIQKLASAGYVYIGMDHFAKPGDELSIALENGTLYRNFQGYSTHSGINLLGIGMSSIGMLSDLYFQNFKRLEDYYKPLDAGILPIMRGVELSGDDLLRREVITTLMCNFHLNKQEFEKKFDIDFDRYFEVALHGLKTLEMDGLVILSDEEIIVTNPGRLLIRNIAMHFDYYLENQQKSKATYSRTV